MNDYLLAAILGLVEGLTEFIPVSSTAHLRIFQALLGISLTDDFWKIFAVVIQVGAILSLPFYFWNVLVEFFASFPRAFRDGRSLLTHPVTLIGIAFIFTAVPALLMTNLIGENLESIPAMATALVVGGVIMWVVDAWCGDESHPHQTKGLYEMSLPQSIWIGLCQAASGIFPGTSRSMATISGGQMVGMTRAVALEFSFLLSIPTMLAASGFDFLRTVFHSHTSSGLGVVKLDFHGAMLLLIGGLLSFIVAYLSVAWFMRWVRHHGFAPFAIYRIVVGALLFALVSAFSS